MVLTNDSEDKAAGIRGRRPVLRAAAAVAALAAFALVIACSLPGAAGAGPVGGRGADAVQLSWLANTDAGLAGYRLYVGSASGVYGAPITLGLVTTTSVTSLNPGATYYFALTAFNVRGQESARTPEITYLAP